MQRYLLCFLALASCAGCVHTPKPDSNADFPQGTPASSEILASLRQPNRLVTNFSSLGTIRMQLPGQAARQRFTRSYINYQRPDRFHASAMKGTQSVNIYIDGSTFLLEHQAERQFYYGREGDHFEDIALDVAPSVVFGEFFLANALAELNNSQVELLHFDAADQSAELGIFTGGKPRRLAHRLTTIMGPDGWHVAQNILLRPDGSVLATTQYDDYAVVDGVFMPKLITTEVPESDGLLSFQIQTNARANRSTPEPLGDIAEIRNTLLAAGYREIPGIPAKGIEP